MTDSSTSQDQTPVAGRGGSWPVGMIIFALSVIMAAILCIPVLMMDLLGGEGLNNKRVDLAIVAVIMSLFFEFFLRRRKNSENKDVHRVIAMIYAGGAVLLLASLAIW